MIRKITLVALATLALAACDNKPATLDTNAYYAEQEDEQLLVDAPTTEKFDVTLPVVEEQPQQPQTVVVQQDDGFDLGDAAIGFVAAELIDEVGDSFESKKKTHVKQVVIKQPVKKAPVIKRVEPKKVEAKKVTKTVVKKEKKKESFFKRAVKKVKKSKFKKRRR
ncbi:hypothetical protein phiGrn1_0259 [Vibrio phage phi-Grn1]|uniref:Lipoprotein n=1 Tax=Vibrio phage phi-Grn1 TaxID=1747713 RepID=A0A126HGF1_9CAUD|nr:hypothetical protein phiGrn1_0259 [Vibrio phage phi-Grn1]